MKRNVAKAKEEPTKRGRRRRAAPRRGSSDALLSFFGKWVGSPEELRRLEREVQTMREQEQLGSNGRRL